MASVSNPLARKKYKIFWYDEDGRHHKKTGTTDKAVSQRIANELENRVALVRDGLCKHMGAVGTFPSPAFLRP